LAVSSRQSIRAIELNERTAVTFQTMNYKLILCSLATVAIVVAGCAGHHESRTSEEVIAPRPPGFLVGPASALLTNGSAFSAVVTVDSPSSAQKGHPLSGQLLCEGSHLVFSPARGDRTFVWDARERNGFILSEALQGYAPFSSPTQITNVATVSETAGPASERVNGHPGHEVEVTVAMDDGSTARFSVWRASDLNGLPVRIKSLNTNENFEVNLSGIQSAKLASTLFGPPDGFTKYENPDIMAGELAMRRSKPKKTESQYFGEAQPVMKNSPPGR
jgi:hypothetical protein